MADLLPLGLAFVVGAALSLAAWGKLSDHPLVLRDAGDRPGAVSLVAAELYMSGLLFFARPPAGAALVALAFLTAATLHLLTFGRGRPCNCFGRARPTPWRVAVLRNCVLLSLCLLALVLSSPGEPSLGRTLSDFASTDWGLTSFLAIAYVASALLLHSGWTVSVHSPFVVRGRGEAHD